MSKVIAVASGKGGVGKTTVAINVAAALVGFGRVSVVVDCDLHAPNVGMHLGSPALPVMINHVLAGEHSAEKAVYIHPSGVRVMPASITLTDCQSSRHDDIGIVVDAARSQGDIILLDCPPGLGRELRSSISTADAVLAVTTPDLVAVADTLKTVHLAQSLGKEVLGAVVNKMGPHAELSLGNVASLLGIPVLCQIQQEASVMESLKLRHPVVYSHPDSPASVHFKELAALVVGDRYICGLHQKE